jgi:hypothetical protein
MILHSIYALRTLYDDDRCRPLENFHIGEQIFDPSFRGRDFLASEFGGSAQIVVRSGLNY